jgi:dethiobiotin synthetase
MVVEGVGGLMSPIAEGATSLDLLLAAGGETVLVVGSYLGAISHALTACEVLAARGHAPRALVLSQRGAPDEPDLAGTVALLEEHLGSTPLHVARHGQGHWAAPLLRDLIAA